MEESFKTRIVTAASRCDVGRVRKINQDTVFCSLEPVGLLPNLFIVADGMGGHKAGDLASTETVRCFVKCIEERSKEAEDIVDLMRLALEEANRYVYYLSQESEDYQGMGTTFVAVTFCGNSLYCINVDDSRLYKLNRAGEQPMSLKKVTEDHSVVEMMIKEGLITEEEARVHPQKNMITRAVGIEETVQIDDFRLDVDNLVRVLLCSDGLSGMLTDLDILNIVSGKDDVEVTAERLLAKANDNGGRDNISVIVIDFTGEEVEHA